MAKVLLVTFGSFGDLHPFIALAMVMRSLGHQVRLASHAHYADKVRRLGLDFIPMQPSLEDVGQEPAWASKANHPASGPRYVIKHLLMPYLQHSYDTLWDATADCDLLVSHSLAFAAPVVAEKRGIPWVSVVLQPMMFTSVHDPLVLGSLPAMETLRPLGPRFHQLLYALLKAPTRGWVKPVHRLRRSLQLRAAHHPLFEGQFSPWQTWALFSPRFGPPQRDWPASVRVLGFPFFDQDGDTSLSPAVSAFLKAGSPPVVFTLGSAVVQMPTAFFQAAYAAIHDSGRRAVFVVGREPQGIPAAAYEDAQICVTPYEPFSALFPTACAVVHQCGIGTTAQVMRAGRPQLCVPFAHDQFDNAARVRRMGLGRVLPYRRLRADRLRKVLDELLADATVAAEAQRESENLATESYVDNLAAAVAVCLAKR